MPQYIGAFWFAEPSTLNGVPATTHAETFSEDAQLFSQKLQKRKSELELSQLELASRAQVSVGYINLLLNNAGTHRSAPTGRKPPNPTLDVIWRLADAFDVDLEYLMDRTQPVKANATRKRSTTHR